MTFNHVSVHQAAYAAWAAWISSRSNAAGLFALCTLAIHSEANGSGDLRNFKGIQGVQSTYWGLYEYPCGFRRVLWGQRGLMIPMAHIEGGDGGHAGSFEVI